MINQPEDSNSARSSISNKSTIRFKQIRGEKIAELKIKSASRKISKLANKKPALSQKFRWVRNTRKNRAILADFLVKTLLIQRCTRHVVRYYSSVYNLFSRSKSDSTSNKKFDPLQAFLDEDQVKEVLSFKKKLENKNYSLPKKNAKELLASELTTYFKNRQPLKKLQGFISSLPERDGCFQLPISKQKLNPAFEKSLSLATKSLPLEFKVDLIAEDPQLNSDHSTPSFSPLRRKKLSMSSNKKANRLMMNDRKRLKVNFHSPVKLHSFNLPFSFKDAERGGEEKAYSIQSVESGSAFEEATEVMNKTISNFHFKPSAGTEANFKKWSQELAKNNELLFPETPISSQQSLTAGGDPAENHQIFGLMGQVKNINLETVERGSGELSAGVDLSPSSRPSKRGKRGKRARKIAKRTEEMTDQEAKIRLAEIPLLKYEKLQEFNRLSLEADLIYSKLIRRSEKRREGQDCSKSPKGPQ